MATYWVKSGTGGTDAGTSWANAAESIPGLMTAQALAGGDIIYVHNTHNFNAGAAITWTLPETGTGLVRVICVDGGDATGASLVDGTVGNITTGARETTGGNTSFTINTSNNINAALFVHGMTIEAGAAGNSSLADITIQTNNGKVIFSACTFFVNSTNAGAQILPGGGTANDLVFINCTFKFGAAGSSIAVTPCNMSFYNCATATTHPTTIFTSAGASGRVLNLFSSGCDWSGATNVMSMAISTDGKAVFSNCAIGTPTTGTHSGYGAMTAEFQACDGTTGTSDILNYYYEDAVGIVQDSQTVYKATSGAQGEQSSGTDTSYSLEMNANTSVGVATPLYTPWVYQFVGSTGNKTVSMIVAHTESAVLTGADIFMEVEYMGEPGAAGTQRQANSAMSIMEVDDGAPIQTGTIYRDVTAAGTNRTDDGIDDWTGITSEKEHTLAASINISDQGYIRCRVGLTKDTTNLVYVDPKITVA